MCDVAHHGRRSDGLIAARLFVLTNEFHLQNKDAKDLQLKQKERAIQDWLLSEDILSEFTPDTNEHADNFDAEMNLLIDFIIEVLIHVCVMTRDSKTFRPTACVCGMTQL